MIHSLESSPTPTDSHEFDIYFKSFKQRWNNIYMAHNICFMKIYLLRMKE